MRAKNKADTRARLIQAALDLYLERGYGNTRAADIAAKAGVAVGTLYLHFGDKDGLLRSVLAETAAGLYQRLAALYPPEGLPEAEPVRAPAAALVDFVFEQQRAVRFLLGVEVSDLQGVAAALELLGRQVEQYLRQKQGWKISPPEINPRLAAHAEIGRVVGLLGWWVRHPEQAKREEIIGFLGMTVR